ncbi:MAG: hypothetical protein V3U75_00575 [Methylococcaceae bacterium]
MAFKSICIIDFIVVFAVRYTVDFIAFGDDHGKYSLIRSVNVKELTVIGLQLGQSSLRITPIVCSIPA